MKRAAMGEFREQTVRPGNVGEHASLEDLDQFQQIFPAQPIQKRTDLAGYFGGRTLVPCCQVRGDCLNGFLSGTKRNNGVGCWIQHQGAFGIEQDRFAGYFVSLQSSTRRKLWPSCGRYGLRNHSPKLALQDELINVNRFGRCCSLPARSPLELHPTSTKVHRI